MSNSNGVRHFAYSNITYQDLIDKGWNDYNDFLDTTQYMRFSKNQDDFVIILECDVPISATSNSFFEIYFQDQLIYRSSKMTLKEVLSINYLSTISDFIETKNRLFAKGFMYKRNKFVLQRKLGNDFITYFYKTIFYAEYQGRIYYLDDIFNFNFDIFEKQLLEDEVLTRGAFLK